MLIIPINEIIARLGRLQPGATFTRPVRSPWVMVPSRAWFEEKFNRQWWEYCTGRGFQYLAGSGMCEQFSRAALAELNFDCIETVRAYDSARRDVHVAAFESFLRITPGEPLNGVPDGVHATVLVALTEDGVTYELWLWEPQNRLKTKLSDALARGVELYHNQ